MEMTVNTPSPKELETKDAFTERFLVHPAVTRTYPTVAKRWIAVEARWAQAKLESQVSVKTDAGEMLLFGSL